MFSDDSSTEVSPDESSQSKLPPDTATEYENVAPVSSGGQPEAPSKSFFGRAKDAVSGLSSQAANAGVVLASQVAIVGKSAVTNTAEAGKQVYSKTGVESVVTYLDSELDRRGVKQSLSDTSTAIGNKLDEVTGKRLVDLLEERLQLQDSYNDILATRLAEALDRLDHVESRLRELEQSVLRVSESHTPLPDAREIRS